MPKVTTQKAGKDYPQYGIQKGDTYFRWAFFRQPDQLSKTYPTREQLTQDEGLQMAYGVFDGDVPTEACEVATATCSLDEAASLIQEKLDNMPEGLQEGDTGQQLQSRIDSIEASAEGLQELNESLTEAEGWEVPEKIVQGADEDDDVFDERVGALLAEKPEDGVYTWDTATWAWTIDMEAVGEMFSSADQIEG